MKELGHRHIDILKIDIEGAEFPWMRFEGAEIIPRVGQLLIELHVHSETSKYYPNEDTKTFVEKLEDLSMRLFHSEINRHAPLWGTELSFIQWQWMQFDDQKAHLQPLP